MTEHGKYYQGPARPVIQHLAYPGRPYGGWIAWNWDTAQWDKIDKKIDAAAEIVEK